MVLTEQDIREMVEEVLDELRHRIDSSLEPLAKKILRMALFGGGTIPVTYLNKVNQYFMADKPLKVAVVNRKGDTLASFDTVNNEILVTRNLLFLNHDIALSTIMHELTHYIDLTQRTKQRTETITCKDDFLARFSYIFNPTEMQARLSEYAEYLKKHKNARNLKIDDDSNRLFISEMREYLETLQNARYKNRFGVVGNTNGYNLVLWTAIVDASKKKLRDTGESDIKNLIDKIAITKNQKFENEADFYKRKAAALKLYGKRLRVFIHKALKIKYDYTVNQTE